MATNGNDFLAGIEIGSDKTSVVVAAPRGNNFDVLGFATVPTVGLKNGAVTSIPELRDTVEKAVMEAESSLSGKTIHSVSLCLFGDYFRVEKRQGTLEIRNRQGEVTEADQREVVRKAAPSASSEYEIVHTIVQEHSLDERRQIKDPVGMSGERLGVGLFTVTAVTRRVKDLKRCLEELHLETKSISYAPLVAAEAVLTPEELESGVAYFDFGRSASTLLVFEPTLREIEVLGRGGDRLNFALAYCLKITTSEAERIKKESGSCLLDVEPRELSLSNAQGESKQITNSVKVAEIIADELEDILTPFRSIFLKYRPAISAGLVLGGGGALLPGLAEFLEAELDMPVRIGTAQRFHGWEKILKNPAYNAVLGVVQASAGKHIDKKQDSSRKSGIKKIFSAARHYWRELS
ncbi:MAG: cell division protein FtsA [Candidatus Omnitrophica bacterium]|nr:cell division protein FtsA [Candidatus Omnitrophota bacterium]